jgi:2,4-dichlorophenol 6-monooxygenase
MEPILRRRVEELAGPGTEVKFGMGVVKLILSDKAGEPTVVILEDGTTVKAKYVVAADGGRTCANELGIAMEGQTNIVDMVSAHFIAPDLYGHLARLGCEGGHPAIENIINYMVNPDLKTGLARYVGS